MPKKSKKAEPDPPAEEEEEEQQEQAKADKKQKKRKKAPEPPPEPEEEEEEEGEEEEEEVDDAKRRKSVKNKKQRQKAANYRKVARKCGFLQGAGPNGSGGLDSTHFTVTLADAKRLAQYVPHDFSKGSFGKEEAEARMALTQERLPSAALRVVQSRSETLMRNILNQSVLRMLEGGNRMGLDAPTVLSVIRPYAQNMSFTAVVPPKGLIKYAQKEGIIGSTPADEQEADADDKEAKEIAKASKALLKKMAEEKAARKAAREERKEARDKAVAA